ncbi:exodeoxyribonuclease VII large subunit [Rhizorhabdus phycosphaerae]|uniref:exodeoxyribonuclease VII large subunit n=1 Tax=Rhizorhabdus phycosphaerae TaxID=2711156 RepID=UPI0013EDA18A|nr:exodeoxyribonuclease VII large subunit [Rhizorhabdus phycosphaerae]
MNDFLPGVPPSDRPRLLAEEQPGDNAPALSVSELSGALKRTVEDAFGFVRVRGEISGFKRHSSGHCYLSLKDERACIDGVVWKGQASAMRFRPEDGIEVIATGKLTTFPGRSKYQIVIDRMELAGQGALMALLDQRRRQLAAEGLFDEERKRPLPFLPRVIGVVTSPTGAVIRDILHRLADRCPSHVILWPVAVQGDAAAPQVARAVRGFGALSPDGPVPRPDLLIVGRGGGSIEDLWAFNEEEVVRAIAESPIPVISAVGHETDTTLADFAADRRAPTPTAAAEMAVPVRADLAHHVRELGGRAERLALRYRERAAERFEAVADRLPTLDGLFAGQQQRLDDLADRLPRALGQRLAHARSDLAQAAGALRPALLDRKYERAAERLASVRLSDRPIRSKIDQNRAALDQLWRLAEQLHPDRPLQRGYVRVERRDGGVLSNAQTAREAGLLTLHFADGAVDARVDGDDMRASTRPPARAKAAPDEAARQQKLF